ncbi:Beta-carotene hydroxylase 2 [Zostera marina]|uniref:beta-carotene 3-hydroxylase n=1 Tax=Zostera marina TaxID=29655 RepID=A0A0K9NQZ8_ZOSMR|nr:Beta-carotene hydroxylase 2 [Zostera marina]
MGTVIRFSSMVTSIQNPQTLFLLTSVRVRVTRGFRPSRRYNRRRILKCMVFLEDEQNSPITNHGSGSVKNGGSSYLLAEVLLSVGLISLDIMIIYLRFWWKMDNGGEISIWEIAGSFFASVGAAVGMELWSRWVHKTLWHAPMWQIHKSHHRPREGAFELNDVFAVMNSFPAIVLISIGYFNSGLLPALCFGSGVGITLVGIAYVLVHDGMVHRRFPVGPIAGIPYLRLVASAHRIHHSEKFNGVPFGFFLGPKELEQVMGQGNGKE